MKKKNIRRPKEVRENVFFFFFLISLLQKYISSLLHILLHIIIHFHFIVSSLLLTPTDWIESIFLFSFYACWGIILYNLESLMSSIMITAILFRLIDIVDYNIFLNEIPVLSFHLLRLNILYVNYSLIVSLLLYNCGL